MTLVLVVNQCGGFPSTLRRNVLETQTWASERDEQVVLPFNDRERCFTKITSAGKGDRDTVFRVAKEWGYRTVLLGPTHWREPGKATVYANSTSLPDPRNDLEHYDVDECSVYATDHATRGMATVYDEDTCERAMHLIERMCEGDRVFLWVNLLCCADLERIRFSRDGNHPPVSVCLHPSTSTVTYKRNQLPLNVTSYVDGISNVYSTVESIGFQRAQRVEYEYANLLHVAWDMLNRLNTPLMRLFVAASKAKASIAHTASHSISIGEHSVRGGNAPLGVCCETFWCSNVPTTRPKRLEDRILQFVALSCGFSLPTPRDEVVVTHGSNCSRFVVQHNGHTYSCIVVEGVLRYVFDLSIDPEENREISQMVQHILPELKSACRTNPVVDALPKEKEVPLASLSHPLSLEPETPRPAPTPNVRPLVSRPPSVQLSPSSVASTPSRRPKRNLRQTEKQLNSRHR